MCRARCRSSGLARVSRRSSSIRYNFWIWASAPTPHLARDLHAQPSVDAFKVIPREMIAVAGDQGVRQQRGCRDAALLQHGCERGDDGRQMPVDPADILAPDRAQAREAPRCVIELLADLFSDADPLSGRGFRFFGIKDDFPDREMFGHSRTRAVGTSFLGKAAASTTAISSMPSNSSSNWAESSFSLLLPNMRRAKASNFWRRAVPCCFAPPQGAHPSGAACWLAASHTQAQSPAAPRVVRECSAPVPVWLAS